MKLDEAKSECNRWLDYLQRQETQTIALQQLARDRRADNCSYEESRRRRAKIQTEFNGVTVYDGANLAKAVRVLLKHQH